MLKYIVITGNIGTATKTNNINIIGDSIIQTLIINSSNFNLTKVGLINEVV